MRIVSLERLLNLSTRAFYLKKCKHEEKEGRLFALLWATREYYDLKVSNKVIIKRVFSMMQKRLVNM